MIASSKASFTSCGGRAFCRLNSLTVRPVRYWLSASCSRSLACAANSARCPERMVSITLLPITSRTALSAAWRRVSSGSRVPNRYSLGSDTWYCTLKSTSTMFSSRVSMRT